jgi:hypothetical protein
MKYTIATLLTALLAVLIVPLHGVQLQGAEPIDIGSRRELFVDHHLI